MKTVNSDILIMWLQNVVYYVEKPAFQDPISSDNLFSTDLRAGKEDTEGLCLC